MSSNVWHFILTLHLWHNRYSLSSLFAGVIVSISLSGDLMILSPKPKRLEPTDDADMILTLGSVWFTLTLTGIYTRLPASR